MRRIKISLHLSTIDRAIGGALYYYGEISRLLSQTTDPDIKVVPHDIFELVTADESIQRQFVESFTYTDVVVSAIGPYAYIYFYLRERYGGNFRIVRDIRTTSWAGFLLQEQLVSPLLRKGDILLCPSEFARQYFISLFPELTTENTFVSYPLAASFPAKVDKISSKTLRIGYIGRISENKNLAQVLSIYQTIRYKRRENVSLHMAGQVSFNSRHVSQKRMFKECLVAHGVKSEDVTYHGYLFYSDIWRFYSNVDVLLFPALANVESLGRVLLESARAHVPVVAANYAASPEFLPSDNIISTRYYIDQTFSTLETFSFGTVDEDDAIEKVFCAEHFEDSSCRVAYQNDRFIRYVKGDFSGSERAVGLGDVVSAFLRSIVLDDRTQLCFAESMQSMTHLFTFFARYNNNKLLHRIRLLRNAMELFDNNRSAAYLYLDRVLRPSNRSVLKHARQFCAEIGYKPTISLRPSIQDRALLLASQPLRLAANTMGGLL